MRRGRAALFALVVWLAALALTAAAVFLQVTLVGGDPGGVARASTAHVLAFGTVGMVIMARRPGHRIGWLFAAIGLLTAAGFCADLYATAALGDPKRSLPGGSLAAWLAVLPSFWRAQLFILLLLLFPTGQLPSPRWRVLVLLLIFTNLQAAIEWLTPGPRTGRLEIPNPLGIPALAALAPALRSGVWDFVFLIIILSAVVSPFLRLRGVRGVERQQLKWFAYSAALMLALFLLPGLIFTLPSGSELMNWIWAAAPSLIPLGAGVAILRYRLYDIDVIINRTLVYGTLTGILALLYWGAVVALQGVLRPFTGAMQNELVTVGATLAIVALIQPLRRRIQAIIDRRFYRRKYDASQTLAAVGLRLRDQTDVERLTAEVVDVVHETLQPSHVSLWLRPQQARGD